MSDKGSLSRANRIKTELAKLIELAEDGPFVGVHDKNVDALRDALERARRCNNNVLAELGDKQAYR